MSVMHREGFVLRITLLSCLVRPAPSQNFPPQKNSSFFHVIYLPPRPSLPPDISPVFVGENLKTPLIAHAPPLAACCMAPLRVISGCQCHCHLNTPAAPLPQDCNVVIALRIESMRRCSTPPSSPTASMPEKSKTSNMRHISLHQTIR
jgi:hypothetical protein